MFYEIYVGLCAEKNISPTKAAVEIGLSNAAPTGWKQGAVPRDSALKKIADYFGVTVEYLKGETDIKNPAAGDGSGMEKELVRLFNLVPEEHRGEAIRYLRFLSDQPKSEEEKKP